MCVGQVVGRRRRRRRMMKEVGVEEAASTDADQKAWKLGEKEGGVIFRKINSLVGKFCGRFPFLINLDPSQSLVYSLFGKPPDAQDQQHRVKSVCHSLFFFFYTGGQNGMKNTRSHFVFQQYSLKLSLMVNKMSRRPAVLKAFR